MDQPIRFPQPPVELFVQEAKFEQLQVRKLDDLQRLAAILIHQQRRRPFGDEQIARAVADPAL